jgi:putative SOS response-associated peptidase YedK
VRQAHPEAPVDVLAERFDLDEYPSSLTASYNIAPTQVVVAAVVEEDGKRKLRMLHWGLIVADGFYEWRKTDGGKQSYLVKLEDGLPFAFAGLWETYKNGEESDPAPSSR